MIQACKSCTKQFDITKQSSLCPHKEHPKLCDIHSRMNCGNFECTNPKGKLHEIKRKEA